MTTIDYLPSKRPRQGHIIDFSEAVMQNSTASNAGSFHPVTGSSGSVAVVGQQFEKKGKWGKKRTLLQRMIQHYKASQNSYVARFQGLSLYNSPTSTYALSNTYVADTKQLFLPMYAFNLTSLPFNRITEGGGTTTISAISNPFYRLTKNTVNGQYNWVNEVGYRTDKEGTSNQRHWNIEWDELDGNPPIQINKYCFDWADVKIAFTGCKRPVKIHVALMKFEHGPNREYYNTGSSNPFTYDVPGSGDDIDDATISWDAFWATRVSNPIRTSRRPDNHRARAPWRIVKHESFMLGQDMTINADPKPLQAVYKKFMDVGKIFNVDNPKVAVAQQANIVGDTTTGAGFGYVGVNRTQFELLTTSGLFPSRDKDSWLVIWADVYDQYKTNNTEIGVYPDGSTNLYDYAPTFDLNVRCKYSYND